MSILTCLIKHISLVTKFYKRNLKNRKMDIDFTMSTFEKLTPLWLTKSENLVCYDNAHKTIFVIYMLLPTEKSPIRQDL